MRWLGTSAKGGRLRTNHVLVDFENLQPDIVDALNLEHFRLVIFVGAMQAKIPLEMAAKVQALGARATYVQIKSQGKNALDMHIAFYIGQIAAHEPSAFFHVVSGDKGFDPLISHLKDLKILAGRVTAISDIPLIKSCSAETLDERVAVVIDRLKALKASKPRAVKTLSTTIASLFPGRLKDGDVEKIIAALARDKVLMIEGAKVKHLFADE